MKKLFAIILAVVVLFAIMFAEYRYIMCNIKPYRGEGGTVYLEIFDNVDEYYAESIGGDE